MKGTGNECNFGEQGTEKIKPLILGNSENAEIFEWNKGTGTHPLLGGPPKCVPITDRGAVKPCHAE